MKKYAISLPLLCAVSMSYVYADETIDSIYNSGVRDLEHKSENIESRGDSKQTLQNNKTKSYKINKINVTVSTATGFQQDLKDAPASMSIITNKDLQGRPIRDLGDAISQVPGVSIDSGATNTGGYAVSIRGMPSSYTLFLVDGARQDASSEAFPNFSFSQGSFMPPISAIDRIEVIRGPASTIYGSDAIGGVVNVILKRHFEKWSSNVTIDTTLQEEKNFGHIASLSLFSAGPIDQDKKLSLQLRAKETYQFAPQTFVVPIPNGSQTLTGNSAIIGAGQNNQAQVGTRLGYSMDEHNYFYIDAAHFNQWYDPEVFENSFFMRNNLIARHQGTYGDKGLIHTDSSIQYNTMYNQTRNRLAQDAILEHRSIIPFWRMKLIAGAQYVYNSVAALNGTQFGGDAPSLIDRHTLSLYAEDEYMILDNLIFTFGGRANINSAFGFNFSPRGYLIYHALESETFGDLTLKGGISTGYKMPTITNVTPGWSSSTGKGAIRVYGNPDLKPESSLNYELTLMHETEWSDIALTAFFTQFKDKISSYSVAKGGDLPAGLTCEANWNGNSTVSTASCQSYYNVDTAQSYGIELAAQLKPIDIGYGDIGATLAYTWNKNKATSGSSKGLPLTDIPEHTLNMAINYNYHDMFGAFLRGEFRANQLRMNVLSRTSAQSALDTFYTNNPGVSIYYKPYFLLHLGGNYNITKNLRLNFGIFNLLNHNFIDFYLANTGAKPSAYNNYATIYESRHYYISVSMDF